MSIEKKTVYVVRCDYCGEELRDAVTSGRRLLPDRGTANLEAKAAGWDIGDGSYALCQPADKGHAKQLREWLGE